MLIISSALSKETLWRDLYSGPDFLRWGGGWTHAARELGGHDFADFCKRHASGQPPNVMAHSHGGNIVACAQRNGTALGNVVLLSCPVHPTRYAFNFENMGKVASVRVKLDLVLLADLAGQHFDDRRICEKILPIYFSHSATDDKAIWEEYELATWVNSVLGQPFLPSTQPF